MPKINRHIDLSFMVRDKSNKIDWVSSAKNGCVILFVYGDISGEITLLEYSHSTRNCLIEYNKNTYNISSNSIVKGCFKNIIGPTLPNVTPPQNRKKNTKLKTSKKYCVYCHENKSNLKKYYGITSQNPSQRWSNGKGYKNNPYFSHAIEKYGWDNFTHSIIYNGLSYDEAASIEASLTLKDKTHMREYGYNIIIGSSFEMSGANHPAAKKVYQYDFNGTFVKRWDSMIEASRWLGQDNDSRISKAVHSRTHECDGYLWFDTEQEFVCPYIIQNCAILQYSIDGELINKYSSMGAIDFSIFNRNCIIQCCNKKARTHKKFIWMYERDVIGIDAMYTIREIRYRYSNTPYIYQYDINGNYITSFMSSTEAAHITGIDKQNIYLACRNKLKQAGNYLWCFGKSYNPTSLQHTYSKIDNIVATKDFCA